MKNSWAARISIVLMLSCACSQKPAQNPETEALDKLAGDFWTWRAKYAPFTDDDVNRIERPGGTRDWSAAAIDKQRKDLAEFAARWKKIEVKGWPVPKQVDYKLIGSALSRVQWELDVNPQWKRDPNFYIAQTLTPVVEALTVPGPYDAARSREILSRIDNIPAILQQGEANLTNPPAPFATIAIQALQNIQPRLHQMATALLASTTLKEQELNGATDRAAEALEKFRQQLQEKLPSLPKETALGRDAYVFFLTNVALIPYSPQELLAMDRQEWDRAVAFEGFGETDDFTSTSRLKDNCVRYVDPPSGNLGYFWRATAEDPRPIAVHEGIPGHYFQLCLSWKHEDPIRRHYYDSGANEGIGFYAEEMMLQAGLFDDSPRTREIIYNFMRLRALRVEVDVKLALGEFRLEQAAKYLQEKIPMDSATAQQEAIVFATGPGQAITYQIGKLQIIKFLAEARMQQGEKFNLRAFHDFVWKNGNVPIALQRWEYLGVGGR